MTSSWKWKKSKDDNEEDEKYVQFVASQDSELEIRGFGLERMRRGLGRINMARGRRGEEGWRIEGHLGDLIR